MSSRHDFDAMFAGIMGEEYALLKLICPLATEMSRLVGEEVAAYVEKRPDTQQLVELGGGTGVTTLSLLTASDRVRILSVDNEPTMQNQARRSLEAWVDSGRLQFCLKDALSALQDLDADSVDIVASAYTLHNFENQYRERVIGEIYRVLKPGGLFANGDRYALDDGLAHTRLTQQEVAGYFKVLNDMQRPDLLEQWVLHLFSDESEPRIMRESVALAQLQAAGFQQIQLKTRLDVNALITAVKA